MSQGVFISKESNNIANKKYKTILDDIKYEVEHFKLSAICLFLHVPRSRTKIKIDYEEVKTYCQKNNVEIWPHGTYILPGLWSITYDNKDTEKSIGWLDHLYDQLEAGYKIGAKGISVHLPRKTLSTVVESMEIISSYNKIKELQKLAKKDNADMPLLLIEMTASSPSPTLTYETPDKLNKLVNALTSNKKITVDWGINLDTCHNYASGVSFSEINSWTKWVDKLSKDTHDKLRLIHLNGAKGTNFGTGKDSHQIPLSPTDNIWGHLVSERFRNYLDKISVKEIEKINLYEKLTPSEKTIIRNSSLNELVQWCKNKQPAAAMIMEINIKDYKNTKFAIDVINSLLSK